ncbi:hypothetical protein ACFWBS_32140 [Streptomyces mirabilis]|uniref:hypothetical protein n=1 Tax=Streptomyces mirabilis TaxID=68239 RepID=UPI0033FD0599
MSTIAGRLSRKSRALQVAPRGHWGSDCDGFTARGLRWAAAVLVCLGRLLATTAAAGANRTLRRA